MHHSDLSFPRLLLKVLLLVVLPAFGTQAATIDARTAPIEQVTVYPGAAVVQRSVKVAPGTRELSLDCLPSSFDVSLLRLDSDASVSFGPVSTETRARTTAVECTGPLEARIKALEERVAGLDAESGSQDLVVSYLHGMAGESAASDSRGHGSPAGANGLQATLSALQHAGQAALGEKHRLARERDVLIRELQPLQADRDRLGQAGKDVVRLHISLAAAQGGVVRLQYQFAGASWSPSYRLKLDTTNSVVAIDRMAEVSQSSGEDWSGVILRLSTGSPRSSPSGITPLPWQVALAPPPVIAQPRPAAMPAPTAMPVRPASEKVSVGDGDAPSPFAMQMLQSGFATEFVVPGKVDIATASQRVSLTLSSVRVPATVKVQTSPQQSWSAWLIAEIERPEGVWPDGPMRLQRDEQIVGQAIWRQGQRQRITIPFGRDELVRVQTVPSLQHDGSAGFIGGRTEEQITHVSEVESRHTGPIMLEVLEASPVSLDDQIKVTKEFQPPPAAGFWMDFPGVIAWSMMLAPQQTARFSAQYTISHPKDLLIQRR